jgi:signal-transduction protein with cAMP-binding, CBS, and nucleotidyltransferase domain
MKTELNKLTQEELAILKERSDVLSFPYDCDLVYDHQIPNAGIALLDGEIELTKKSKTLKKIDYNCLYGVQQLLEEKPVKLGCKIKKNSKVILLGRSEIIEALQNPSSRFSQLIQNIAGPRRK